LAVLQKALEVSGLLGISKPDHKNEAPCLLVRIGLHIILKEGSVLRNQNLCPRRRGLLRDGLFLGQWSEVDQKSIEVNVAVEVEKVGGENPAARVSWRLFTGPVEAVGDIEDVATPGRAIGGPKSDNIIGVFICGGDMPENDVPLAPIPFRLNPQAWPEMRGSLEVAIAAESAIPLKKPETQRRVESVVIDQVL
jgi:hypothetical protein